MPHVVATFATAGVIRERLAKGERPDVVIAPSDDVFLLMKKNLIDVASRRALGMTEVGVAVAGRRARSQHRDRRTRSGPRCWRRARS